MKLKPNQEVTIHYPMSGTSERARLVSPVSRKGVHWVDTTLDGHPCERWHVPLNDRTSKQTVERWVRTEQGT